jgi:hypothetical protein
MSNLGVPLAVTLDPIFVGSVISAGRDAKVALIQFTDFPRSRRIWQRNGALAYRQKRSTLIKLDDALSQFCKGASRMGPSILLSSGTNLNARWKQLYAAAILELDDTKLPNRIVKARVAMRARAEDPLAISSDEERRSLDDGFRILRVLEQMTTKRNPAA